MKAKNAMLCWNKNGGADILFFPDETGFSKNYTYTALAPDESYRKASKKDKLTYIYMEAMHAIIRDEVNPKFIHAALCKIDEYKESLASDMPFYK